MSDSNVQIVADTVAAIPQIAEEITELDLPSLLRASVNVERALGRGSQLEELSDRHLTVVVRGPPGSQERPHLRPFGIGSCVEVREVGQEAGDLGSGENAGNHLGPA